MDDWLEEDLTRLAEGDKARRVLDERMLREPIRRLEPRAPLALPPDGTVAEAVRLMREEGVGCVLAVESQRVVGILTERDVLMKVGDADLGRPIGDLMTAQPEVLGLEDPIVYALNKMSVGGFRHVPLVDPEGRPVGVVSVRDIVDYIVDFFPNEVRTVPPDPSRGEAWRGREGG
jgi:CBS domain-containing protein